MSVQIAQPVKPGKKGGGGIGGLLGLLGGVAATVATGGLAGPITAAKLGTALGLASGGSAIGRTVGGMVAPGKEAERNQGMQMPEDGAMTRRIKSGETQAKLEQLKQSALATADLPAPERQQYLEPIMTAAAIMKRQNQGEVA